MGKEPFKDEWFGGGHLEKEGMALATPGAIEVSLRTLLRFHPLKLRPQFFRLMPTRARFRSLNTRTPSAESAARKIQHTPHAAPTVPAPLAVHAAQHQDKKQQKCPVLSHAA